MIRNIAIPQLKIFIGRNFHISSCNGVREILTKTDGNVTTIEGRITESPRKSFLIKPDPKIVTNACILCRLNLDIKHTDVLILHQFITSEGEMLPKRLTGLCRKQYHFISQLVAMAQEAGLLGNFVTWEGKFDISQRQGYKKPNTYFDESTIVFKKKKKKSGEDEPVPPDDSQPSDNMTKESIGSGEELEDSLSFNYQKSSNIHWIFVLIYGSALFSWIIGSIGLSFAWIVITVSTAVAISSSSLTRIIQDARNEEIVKIRRRKALSKDETAEWLNFLFNRWWACSSATSFQLLRDQFEPLLNEVKPSFVESVEFRQFTFGDQTPCIKSIKAYDILDGKRLPLTSLTLQSPSGLIKSAQHKIAMIVDLYLNSEDFRLLLKTRLFGKGVGVDLDIALEKLNICGKLDIVLCVDMESPFPHVTEVSVMFLEKPEIWFSLRMLKAVQMMEVPILKSWIHSVVMDALETSLVDPGKLQFRLSGSKEIYPDVQKGVSSAQGVLTITLTASQPGGLQGDQKWIVLRMGDQYCKTSPVTQNWSEAPSFLVESLQTDKLIIKLKNKRLVSTITLAQYEMNLIDYNLDYSRTVETLLQKKSKMSNIPNISVRLEYTPLVFDMIDQPTARSLNAFVVSGVMTVLIHGAKGLIFSDSGPSNSYCVIYVDRKKVKTTHCIADSAEPQWESRCQFLVNDYTKTSLSFVVCCSWNQKRITNDEMLGLAVLNLTEGETCITNKELFLNGSTSSSSITVSVTFQPVSEMSNKCVNNSPSEYYDTHFKEVNIKTKKDSQSWMRQAKNIIVRNDPEFQSGENIGNILTSGQGLLEFNLLRAKDLLSMDKNGFSDPYYELQINGECKYKSSVKKKTLNPMWDENGIVPLPNPGSTLDLILWDHDTFGKNDFLGKISFTLGEIRNISCSNFTSWHTLQGVRSGQVEVKIRIISDPLLKSSVDSAAPLTRRKSMERSKIKLGVNVPPPAPPRNFVSQHRNATETLVEQIHRNFVNDIPIALDNASNDNHDSEKKSQMDASSITRTSSRASSCRTSDFSVNDYSPLSGEGTAFTKKNEDDLPPFKSMKQRVTRSLRLRKFRSESNVRIQNGNSLEVKKVTDYCSSQTSLSNPVPTTCNSQKAANTPVRPTELNICPTARPDRYSGVEGKVLQAQGLHVAHVAQLYCRIKLIGAQSGEKGYRSGHNYAGKTLAKSDLYPAVPNPQFNLPFQIVSPESVARQAVLQFEIRSSGKENVALRRVTLQDLLSADGKETHTWLALNNGASLEVVIAHGRELKKSSRKLFRSWSVHRIGKI